MPFWVEKAFPATPDLLVANLCLSTASRPFGQFFIFCGYGSVFYLCTIHGLYKWVSHSSYRFLHFTQYFNSGYWISEAL
jgi:hypothetical protein